MTKAAQRAVLALWEEQSASLPRGVRVNGNSGGCCFPSLCDFASFL